MQIFRYLLFIFLATLVFIVLFFGLLLGVFSRKIRGYFLRGFAWCIMRLLKIIFRVDYRVIGRENIPKNSTFIIFSNHQSVWETIALQEVFSQPIIYVAKKSLLWIPLYGWCFFLTRPITIDRKASKQSIRQIKTIGKKKLESGEKVIIFPEGTRTPYGKPIKFKKGGSILAKHAQFSIVPVAHNAGKFWKKSGIKNSSIITMKIGEPIDVTNKTSQQINQEAENWVNQAMVKIASLKE